MNAKEALTEHLRNTAAKGGIDGLTNVAADVAATAVEIRGGESTLLTFNVVGVDAEGRVVKLHVSVSER